MRAGIRLGVDVGSVRVGLAASDPGGILATPIRTIVRDLSSGSDQVAIEAVVLERDVLEVVVGLPRSLSGSEGPAAEEARSYAKTLAARLAPVPVRLIDEHAFDCLEQPRFFGDAMHLNQAGSQEFSRMAARETARVLGR